MPPISMIGAQDDEEVVIVTRDNEVTLTEDEVENLFQDASTEEELGTEWLQAILQALQEEPSLWQTANVIDIHIFDWADANFPVKITGVNVIACMV